MSVPKIHEQWEVRKICMEMDRTKPSHVVMLPWYDGQDREFAIVGYYHGIPLLGCWFGENEVCVWGRQDGTWVIVDTRESTHLGYPARHEFNTRIDMVLSELLASQAIEDAIAIE